MYKQSIHKYLAIALLTLTFSHFVRADPFQDHEPVSALVSSNAVARLPDGKVLLMVPAPGKQSLYVSKDDHPATMADFEVPLDLFGENGLLTPTVPDTVGVAVSRDTIHIVSTTQNQIDWYWTHAPITANSHWEHSHVQKKGLVSLQDIMVNPTSVTPLVIEQNPTVTAWTLALAQLDGDGIQTKDIVTREQHLKSAKGSLNDDDTLNLVWEESLMAPNLQRIRIDPRTGRSPHRFVSKGKHPDILSVGDVTYIASEQSDGTIGIDRFAADNSVQKFTVKGRAFYRPTLCLDDNGVVWLFAADLEQRGLYYRRFLGSGFSDEYQCGGASGSSKLSTGFAVQPRVEQGQYGFAILSGSFLNADYKYHFGDLPVPRFSVRDSRHILFLDMLEVAEMKNVRQKVSTAVKSEANPLKLTGPVGAADDAWAQYATVLHENDKFRMWYGTDDRDYEWNWTLAYAESKDGINWTKPNLGIVEYKGSKNNNLIIPNLTGKEAFGTTAVAGLITRDDAEEDPARRYKMVFESVLETGEYGVYLIWSEDGIHWSLPPHRLWGRGPGRNQNTERMWTPWPEPLMSFFYDPLTPNPDYRYKVYGQSPDFGHPHQDPKRPRNLSMVYGPTPYDFKPYVNNPVLDPRTGVDEDQIHGALVQPYDGLYVTLYQHWWGDDWNVDLRLAVSRDGIHFSRVDPEHALLPLGPQGSWDSGMLCTPASFFQHDQKIWLYYRGSIGTLTTGRALRPHGVDSPYLRSLGEPFRRYTGLARLRTDGFAFMTLKDMTYLPQEKHNQRVPKYEVELEGRILTIPMDAEGIEKRDLHVNVANFAPGFAWMKAQLRDADTGNIIPGYGWQDCDRIDGDSTDHTVTWNGSAKLNGKGSRRVQIEFQLFGMLDSPQFYSFWFADR